MYALYASKKISCAFKKLNTPITFIFLLAVSLFSKSQNIDLHLLKTLNAGNHPKWDNIMKGTSWSVYPAMVIESGGVLGYGYYKKDETMIRNGYKSILCIGAANVISLGLKYAVNAHPSLYRIPN